MLGVGIGFFCETPLLFFLLSPSPLTITSANYRNLHKLTKSP